VKHVVSLSLFVAHIFFNHRTHCKDPLILQVSSDSQ